jgi:hypothetical protein
VVSVCVLDADTMNVAVTGEEPVLAAVMVTVMVGDWLREEDAVVDRENATDTEEEPESDREPKVAERAALPVPRALTEEEPVAVKEGSEEAVYEAVEHALSVERRDAVVDTVEVALAVAVRSGVLEAVAQEEGVAELCGEADTVAVPLTVAQGEAVLELERVSRAEAEVEEL